eukprot:m.468765 g.468765  ORF g.468765 m.468765 type:complete len:825 (+) comp57084_c0_seq2:212-2686(+)
MEPPTDQPDQPAPKKRTGTKGMTIYVLLSGQDASAPARVLVVSKTKITSLEGLMVEMTSAFQPPFGDVTVVYRANDGHAITATSELEEGETYIASGNGPASASAPATAPQTPANKAVKKKKSAKKSDDPTERSGEQIEMEEVTSSSPSRPSTVGASPAVSTTDSGGDRRASLSTPADDSSSPDLLSETVVTGSPPGQSQEDASQRPSISVWSETPHVSTQTPPRQPPYEEQPTSFVKPITPPTAGQAPQPPSSLIEPIGIPSGHSRASKPPLMPNPSSHALVAPPITISPPTPQGRPAQSGRAEEWDYRKEWEGIYNDVDSEADLEVKPPARPEPDYVGDYEETPDENQTNRIVSDFHEDDIQKMHAALQRPETAMSDDSHSSENFFTSHRSRPKKSYSTFVYFVYFLSWFGKNPDCWFDYLHSPVSGSMSRFSELIAVYPFLSFLDALLRGLGQVILVNNPFSGIVFLIASIINCKYCCVLGLFGLVTSTVSAKLWSIPQGAIQAGLYGYNGYLVGHAMAIFQIKYHGDWNWFLIVPIVILCSIIPFITTGLSLIIRNLVGKPSGVFTFPFHVMTWIWLLNGQRSIYFPNSLGSPSLVVATSDDTQALVDYDWYHVGRAVPIGIGQVFFFDDFTAGCLVLIGVGLYSRISAVFAVLGSTVGAFYAVAIGAPAGELYAGLWGYDATIVGITLGGLFLYLNTKLLPYAFIGIFTVVMMHGALKSFLAPVGMPPLTFPASVCNVLFTAIAGSFPGIIVIPLDQIASPEQHCALNLNPGPNPLLPVAFDDGDEYSDADPNDDDGGYQDAPAIVVDVTKEDAQNFFDD